MRRWFLALLTLLVAAQMSWAAAAVCCLGELPGQPEGGAALVVSEQAHTASTQAHPVCETAGHCHCHHAGCATGVESRPATRTAPPAPPAHDAARPDSHIPAGLDRPNWLRA